MFGDIERTARGGNLVFHGMDDDGGRGDARQRFLYRSGSGAPLPVWRACSGGWRRPWTHPCAPSRARPSAATDCFSGQMAHALCRCTSNERAGRSPENGRDDTRAWPSRRTTGWWTAGSVRRPRLPNSAAMLSDRVAPMHRPPMATVLYCRCKCTEFFQGLGVPVLPMRDRTRRIAVHEAVTRDVRHVHGVAGLLQTFGQRQQFDRDCFAGRESAARRARRRSA